MHVGLIGFGKTGRAVATILLESPTVHLDWVVRNSHFLEHRNAPEYLGLDSSDDGHIYSREAIDAETLLNQHPVDAIIDFSAPAGLDYYALAAAKRGVTVITAVSYYPEAMLAQLAELAPAHQGTALAQHHAGHQFPAHRREDTQKYCTLCRH